MISSTQLNTRVKKELNEMKRIVRTRTNMIPLMLLLSVWVTCWQTPSGSARVLVEESVDRADNSVGTLRASRHRVRSDLSPLMVEELVVAFGLLFASFLFVVLLLDLLRLRQPARSARRARGAAQVPTASNGKWNDGVVPYFIENYFYPNYIDEIMAGMALIENATRHNGVACIRFVPRTTQETYVHVRSGTGCHSAAVGKQMQPGKQEMSLEVPYCAQRVTVAHNFMHVLGFWHEEVRPDRDNFVRISFEDLEDFKHKDFEKKSEMQVDILNSPYDYESIMHSNKFDFSKTGRVTVEPLQAGVTIGNASHLSQVDIEEVRRFYNCR